ncbi:c-type lectin-like iev/eev glycoprotein [Pteropox virus]|uniref:C-type lectin-like iev/eev glycoprotein n=1 Tax=Pteropox virus TaxID=1873698 RepID=A0A1B1MRM2_9POXV|nr:c-type lectin-like iev/eev glycoprotein [Pteropox virus]ANS71213.1 c-type lectin-like iev/eev glycoprotein [Pteropox virus]
MALFRKLNRQSKNKIKKCYNPTAVFITILSLLSSIGAILKYTNILITEACENNWIAVDGFCYYSANTSSNRTHASNLCKNYNADLLSFQSSHHVLVVYGLTNSSTWIDVGNSLELLKKIDNDTMTPVVQNLTMFTTKLTDQCVAFNGTNVILSNCSTNANVMCSKKFFSHKWFIL